MKKTGLTLLILALLATMVLFGAVSATAASPPFIVSIIPTQGIVGALAYINGANFGTADSSSKVTFNGTAATLINWTDTGIIVQVPAGATTGPVVVHNLAGNSNAVTFTVNGSPNPPL
jgi:uncharacterized protein (TIGR03437 family)